MRRLVRAIAALASFAGLALPAIAEPETETEAQKSSAAQEEVQPAPVEEATRPAPPPEKVDDVPAFEAPDPNNFSVIDPNAPPPGDLPTPAEMQEEAIREAVGRQTQKLENQSSHGVGQSYYGGGIF